MPLPNTSNLLSVIAAVNKLNSEFATIQAELAVLTKTLTKLENEEPTYDQM